MKDFDLTSVIIQYIDDILICSEDKPEHERDVRLFDFLYNKEVTEVIFDPKFKVYCRVKDKTTPSRYEVIIIKK